MCREWEGISYIYVYLNENAVLPMPHAESVTSGMDIYVLIHENIFHILTIISTRVCPYSLYSDIIWFLSTLHVFLCDQQPYHLIYVL